MAKLGSHYKSETKASLSEFNRIIGMKKLPQLQAEYRIIYRWMLHYQ